MTRQDQINAWWEHKKQVYPYECKLTFVQMAEHPKGPQNNTSMFEATGIDFVTTDKDDIRLFRFRTEHDLLAFQKLYGATTS